LADQEINPESDKVPTRSQVNEKPLTARQAKLILLAFAFIVREKGF
jgi:hypothetical protein